MPEGVGYGKDKSQFYQGEGVDPENEYAHEYHKGNPEKGTHPYPHRTAAGVTSMDYSHPAFGGRGKK